jgi:hypothetical protein
MKGEIPDPAGIIRLQFNRKGDKVIQSIIELPAIITETFLCKKNRAKGFEARKTLIDKYLQTCCFLEI